MRSLKCRPRLSCLLASTLSLAAACTTSGNSGTTGSIQRRPTGGSTTGSVGSSLGEGCASDADCGGGLTCFTNVPGGYCSSNCDTDANCPAGASCVVPLPGAQICVSSCQSVNDCTRAGYACDTDCSVCVPDGTQTLVSCAGHQAGGGGHLPDGGACGASLGDGGFVSWSAAVEVSANPLTSSEAQGVLLVGGGTSLTSAFMVVPADAGSPPPENWIGLATSPDDGAGFTSQAPIADEPGTISGDPSLAMDSSGNQYLAYFGYDPSRGGIAHLWVATQGDGGWSSPQDVLGPGDLADAGGGIDWPFLAVNPVTRQPLIVFADFAGLFGGFGPYRIKLIAGQPGGTSFLPSVDVDDGTRLAFRDLPSMAFDQTGMLYLAWVEASDPTTVAEDQATGVDLTGSTTNAVYFTTATVRDGGAVTVAPSNRLVSGDAGESIVVDSAHLAVEPDGTGVFVTYVVAASGGGTDIELAVSHNQGFTWPVHTVVDDQPGCATHFHPSPFLDIKNRLWVSWVDNRDGAGNVYCAFSSNSGVSFSPSQRVSSQPFFFTTLIPSSYGGVPAWLGGSQMMTGSGTQLYATWTGAEGGTSNNSPAHVYFAKAPLP